MKKIYLLLMGLIFSSTSNIKAQTYVPFPDSNAVWNVLEFYPIGGYWNDSIWNNTMHYGLFGDTLINSLNYNKLFYNNGLTDSTIELSSPNTIYCGAIREETPTKKIYYVSKDSVNESLIYDFSLNIHDTITIKTILGENIIVCNDIDSMLINNHYRKRYTVWSITTVTGEHWIDGIGSKNGLLYTFYFPIFDTIKYGLLCFHQNDTLVYQMDGSMNYWPIPASLYNSGCYHQDLYITTNINEYENNQNPHINIYPNPITSTSNMTFPNEKNNFTRLEIYNVTGTLIQSIDVTTKTSHQIDKKDFTTGVYFIRLVDRIGNFLISKFLII